MDTKRMWMVRAGVGAKYVDDFLDESWVAIGWTEAGEIDAAISKKEIEKRLARQNPQDSKGAIAVWAAQLKRYYSEVQEGHGVTTYDPGRRLYYMGTVDSPVETQDHPLGRRRAVKWTHKVARDSLSVGTRNSLGSISTLFLVPSSAAAEMVSKAVAADADVPEPSPTEPPTDKDQLDEVVSKAKEFIEDRIARLGWEDMQELVAGILEAMGYRARVSSKGADRGVDIFASPDGLGLEEPRIFVEVKHRPATAMRSSHIRAFLGGRRQGDRCLYVSTGGFTKDARYEAERSSVPVNLVTLVDLRELLVEHYPKLDAGVAALVPLEKLYWPMA